MKSATELWQTSDLELVEALVAAETKIRQTYSHMLDLLSELDQRGAATKLGYSNTPALLMHVLRISRSDARHRLQQIEDLLERTTPTGSVVEASLPQTAEALARGDIGVEQVDVIRKTLDGLSDLAPEDRAIAEHKMLERAAQDEPRALARYGNRYETSSTPTGHHRPTPNPNARHGNSRSTPAATVSPSSRATSTQRTGRY